PGPWEDRLRLSFRTATAAAACGFALLIGPAHAVAAAQQSGGTMTVQGPMTIAGGDLDPAFPDADIYIGPPKTATPPPRRACAVAARYVELVNAGEYAAVAALFADDATFLEPLRPTLRGHAEIEQFYVGKIGSMKPHIIPVSYHGDERECMVEL